MKVDHTCEAISDMQLHLTELVRSQHDRYTVAQTEVERSRSQLQEITAKLQHSQDDIEVCVQIQSLTEYHRSSVTAQLCW